MNDFIRGHIALLVVLASSLIAEGLAQTTSAVSTGTTSTNVLAVGGGGEERIILPESVPDPLEPFNRVVYAFNKGIMIGLVKPTAKVYRRIVVKPVRTAIGNFGKNITYPGRLFNNLLEGKWAGARDETYRFGCNTTVGLAGFFDVASKWKIPKSDADFGQTFGQWGWDPHCYLMLPIYGPSNERDTLGLAADTAANPLTYIAPYPSQTPDILAFISPYTYISYGILYNNLTDTVDDYARFSQAEMDAYSELQYAWTFARENRVADFEVKGEPDPASLETLQSVFFTMEDPEFPNHSRTRSVMIPSTGRKLKYTYWLQPGNAPVVYVIPGLGSHRLATTAMALAELAYKKGYSAVCVSSTFNFEFMENASTAEVPAYMPVDVHDLHVALTEIDHRMEKDYPGRLGRRGLMGYSMGGFETLLVAADAATNQPPLLKFDLHVAINAPVRLLYGISKLDEFYRAPLAWPTEERANDIHNTFLKVAALSKSSFSPSTTLPFDGTESKFLIGMAFRLILRDVIYSSQRRNNHQALAHPLTQWRRAEVYKEILQYSYEDYLKKFLVPYYWSRGIDISSADRMDQIANLRNYAKELLANPGIRVFVNQDDFLLPPEDLRWLQETFTGEQLTVFEKGGHLGNLAHPSVKKAISQALENLRLKE